MPRAPVTSALAAQASAMAGSQPGRWQGLAPVVSADTVVLVLGSFPGAASLRVQQYYAHPQNQFWRILQALWPRHALPPAGPEHYVHRCEWLLARGLGLWDVYESCERIGSLDSSIRNARVNDFAWLRGRCPRLAALAHNGAESFRHAQEALQSLALAGAPLPQAARLPSTSPANAAWSFERKLAAWAELMAAHRLI